GQPRRSSPSRSPRSASSVCCRATSDLRGSLASYRSPRRALRFPGSGELALDLVDQLFVQVEESAEEVDHELQVFLPVGQVSGASFGVVEALAEVGDVVAQSCEALAGDFFADEVADQQARSSPGTTPRSTSSPASTPSSSPTTWSPPS